MSRSKCPHCSNLLVNPSGSIDSKILLVGEFPGLEEIRQGVAFCGPTGEILKSELAKVGIQFSACRATNLWQHSKNEKECPEDWHATQLYKEFKNKMFILLMGSDLTQLLFQKSVLDLSGLMVHSPLLPKKAVVYVSPNPAILLHGPVGEFRNALKNFKSAMKES